MQIELEAVCTAYLKRVGGYLLPDFEPVTFDAGGFEQEASVIIPVRNRIRTIEDAIRSVLAQKTTFRFNLIIVDNHSTDGTSEAIGAYTADGRVVHRAPERSDLGSAAARNVGVHHPACGKFAVQLSPATMICGGPDRCRRSLMLFMNRTARWLSNLSDDSIFEMERNTARHHRPSGVDA
ncbi:MAG: glycosyltransferase family A protein [Parabacteroides merdae]